MINDLDLKIEGGYLCALKKKWKTVVLKKKGLKLNLDNFFMKAKIILGPVTTNCICNI